MGETITLSWDALQQLMPLCVEFSEQRKRGEQIDLHDAVNKAAAALGIEDLDGELKQRLSQGLEGTLKEGLGTAFGEEDSKALAAILAGAAEPAAALVLGYAKGELGAEQLVGGLNQLLADNAGALQEALVHSLGIPEELAQPLAEKLGDYQISILCFAAAYKIYRQAARDLCIAREHRIEVERLCADAIAQLKAQRDQMEQLLGAYLLDRLVPFEQGIHAMDEALAAGDDDAFVAANAELWELFGYKAQYSSASEFDDLMLSDQAFKL